MTNKTVFFLALGAVMVGLVRTDTRAAEGLPPRALARLGDHRFYHGPGITCIALSPDGRRAASAARYPRSDDASNKEQEAYDALIVLWDAASGERLRELRLPQGAASRLAFSTDGKQLAASHGISDESAVVLFDVETGKLLRRLGGFQAEISQLQFSSDGKQLRVSEWGGPVSAWDAATGKRLRLWKPPPPTMLRKSVEVRAAQGMLSPDGKTVVWEMGRVCREGCPSMEMDGLSIHDAATNKRLYQKKFLDQDEESSHNELVWSYAFTADGKRLLADCNRLAVWETTTGRELTTLKVPGMVRFTLAPDGRRAAIEETVEDRIQTRLRLWDLETGKPLRELCTSFEDSTYAPSRMLPVFSADGKTLLTVTDSTLRLFDANTGEERGVPGHRAPVAPRYSTDGRTLFTTCADQRCRWNAAEAKPILLHRERRKAWEADCLAQSVDAQLSVERFQFLEVGFPQYRIHLRETATGRVLRTLPEYVYHAQFSPDGARLLLYGVGIENYAHFRFYDVKTGEKTNEIQKEILCGDPVFSPNSRLLAWADSAGVVHLHEAATGKKVCLLRPSRSLPHGDRISSRLQLLFSPDGEQLFVTGHFRVYSESGSGRQIRLPLYGFRVAEGREIARFYADPEKTSAGAELVCLACSPDGRQLAVAEESSGTIRLLEIASGKVRAEFVGHRHGVHGLAFAPDGKTLASGGEDNVVFLWDVTGARTSAAKPPHESDLPSLWKDLASEDGRRAGLAIASLLRKPEASAAFLQEHLRPAEATDEKRLAQWIADLDADAFEKRETASRELTRLGERAEAALRRALTHRPSLEMRRRIEEVLSKLEPNPPPPESLRALRAIEVLEHLGTPAARRCLQALAAGAPDARPTREAKAAMQRLNRDR